MADLNENLLVDHLYYNKLPPVYREMDEKQSPPYPLYRYLRSLFEGGFADVLLKTTNLLDLTDPDRCPDEYFKYLFESFGYPFDPDIDIIYMRRILANHGELQKRRGTISSVRFLVRVLTGMECEITYLRGEYLGEDGRHLIINLLPDNLEEVIDLDLSLAVINRYITLFIPYYIYPINLSTKIADQIINGQNYRGTVVTSAIFYGLPSSVNYRPASYFLQYIATTGISSSNNNYPYQFYSGLFGDTSNTVIPTFDSTTNGALTFGGIYPLKRVGSLEYQFYIASTGREDRNFFINFFFEGESTIRDNVTISHELSYSAVAYCSNKLENNIRVVDNSATTGIVEYYVYTMPNNIDWLAGYFNTGGVTTSRNLINGESGGGSPSSFNLSSVIDIDSLTTKTGCVFKNQYYLVAHNAGSRELNGLLPIFRLADYNNPTNSNSWDVRYLIDYTKLYHFSSTRTKVYGTASYHSASAYVPTAMVPYNGGKDLLLIYAHVFVIIRNYDPTSLLPQTIEYHEVTQTLTTETNWYTEDTNGYYAADIKVVGRKFLVTFRSGLFWYYDGVNVHRYRMFALGGSNNGFATSTASIQYNKDADYWITCSGGNSANAYPRVSRNPVDSLSWERLNISLPLNSMPLQETLTLFPRVYQEPLF